MHSPPTSHLLTRRLCLSALIFVLLLGGLYPRSDAQITLDGSLGSGTSLTGPAYIIPADAGQQHGGNLFHSFGLFHLHTGESATFTGPDSVHNVIGRVTGGQASIINGVLRSDIPGANLFLLNPQGIMFGPNAALDVAGSFHGSTAATLRFADGAIFAVGGPSTLTVAAPAAFGFEPRSTPAPITVDGSHLEVPEGETLAIIGGDLMITGDALSDFADVPTLDAPGGRLHLVSVASPREIGFDAGRLRVDTIERFGTITISDAALLSASGEQGGTVAIHGGNLVVDNSDIFADTFGDRSGAEIGIDITVTDTFTHTDRGCITTDSFGAGHAGDIRIRADILRIEDEAFIASGAFAEGNTGDLTVEATRVLLTRGARIDITTLDRGQGGTITVRASEAVLLMGPHPDGGLPSTIVAGTRGAGDAGTVLIEGQTVTLTGGASIGSSTVGAGRGGAVTVRALDAVTLIGTSPDNTFPSSIASNALGFPGQVIGDGGRVLVEAPKIMLTGGANISSETISTGNGGTVTVRATEALVVTGTDEFNLPSSVTASTLGGLDGAGDGGSILIEAGTVVLSEGARISSETVGVGNGGEVIVHAQGAVHLSGISSDGVSGSEIAANTLSLDDDAGQAGTIEVEAGTVQLSHGARIRSNTRGPGQGGAVSVMAQGAIILEGRGPDTSPTIISAEAGGAGDAGTVLVSGQTVALSDGARISSATGGSGRGGRVSVTAIETVTIDGPDSGLTTDTAGKGAGGDITVATQELRLTHGASISAQSTAGGNAGTMTITATGSFVSDHSTVTTSTLGTGDAGAIVVSAQTLTLREGSQIRSASQGAGEGGTVTVMVTERLEIDGPESGLVTAATGSGRGGDIRVDARDIHLRDEAVISSQSSGTGDAGTIALSADDTLMSESSTITTAARQADGGNIRITAGNSIRLQNSQVTATVGEGRGMGGNIDMQTKFVTLMNSRVRADAFGGPGGNITIVADALLADPASSVTASSARNVDGEIKIQALVADLSGVATPLSQDFLRATALIPQRCAVRRAGRPASSLVIAGRDSIPAEPDGALPSPPVLAPWARAYRQKAKKGLQAYERGDFARAVASWTAVAKLAAQDEQPLEQSVVLTYLGQAYQALGQVTKARQYFDMALALARATDHRPQIATVLGQLGNTYAITGPVHMAEQHLQQAFDLALAFNDASLLARIANIRGNLSISQAQPQAALASYLRSIELAQLADQPTLAVYVRVNAADAALQAGQYEDAALHLTQVLKRLPHVAPTHDIAYGLIKIGLGFGHLRQHLPQRRDALVRRALDAFHAAAQVAQTLIDERSLAYAWGYLGDLYASERHDEEALALTRRAITAAQRVQAPESLYRWQWQIGRLLHAQGQLPEALDAYRRAVDTVQSIRHELAHHYGKPPTSFRASTGRLYFEFVDLLLQRAARSSNQPQEIADLKEARRTIEQFKAAELQDYFRDDCVDADRSQVTSLDVVSKTAIVVYPILLPNRIELLVSLPDGLHRFEVPVSAERVTQESRDLRIKLGKRTSWAFLPHAQQLYDWLIRPLEPALDTIELDTLVFVPDGPLRTIPIAVLHDGEQFLIRKYATAITPGLDLTDPRPLQRAKAKVLAMGLTKSVQGFPPLPHVKNELQAVQNLYASDTMINEDFRVSNMEQQLRNDPFTMVHIASHGQFNRDVEQTFLLTFDGKLTMDRLDQLVGSFRFRQDPLELLTLSACQTAAGDDRAALGLAGIAIKAGARSALATLWFINDESSTLMVSEFYRQLRDALVSRAVALQRAQLTLLEHPVYEHPVYWAPFLLINNWL